MKLMPNISKSYKENLMGGIIGSLTVQVEKGLSYFVAGYPQVLKDQISPFLPRNGGLVATLAPPAIAWAVTKKRSSSRKTNLKNGIFFYDFPKLLDQIAYNVGFQMGVPPATAGLRLVGNGTPLRVRLNNSPRMMSAPTSGGKYVLKTSTPSARATPSGMGKYR